ncbi:hypothetical protein HYFRA_00001649 [Hymenoscyphus fraxineus]|uniref:Zn(2)-C6 fungal-type domain-containing protein n=1 Tax=Hymenoscyphus fraxineus TaxID=746836 RepID=A0A9N9L828_9HELO|nr:hypothetical protein HYFRA_00001649 [Hymenoscyphus fraxineus]
MLDKAISPAEDLGDRQKNSNKENNMSQRQSCDRCRQQKVRCFRDDTLGLESSNSFLQQSSLMQCKRCAKAGVGCIYSPTTTIANQRSNRRQGRISTRRNTEPGPGSGSGSRLGLGDENTRNGNTSTNIDPNEKMWFEQGLDESLFPGEPSQGANYADFIGQTGQLSNLDENKTPNNNNMFFGWDADIYTTPSAVDAAPTKTAIIDGEQDSDDSEDASVHDINDATDSLTSQLITLSRRVTRAMRRVNRLGPTPLAVSSPEVSEALEHTNSLIRIIEEITKPDRNDIAGECGVAFSALACHQHLLALFRAMCNAIHRCLRTEKENQQQPCRKGQDNDVGPSAVAQFVMVLQLLVHLISRMDRILFQEQPSMMQGNGLSSHCYVNLITPTMANEQDKGFTQSEAAGGPPLSPKGLLDIAQDILGTILNGHGELRQVIQELQSEMESYS